MVSFLAFFIKPNLGTIIFIHCLCAQWNTKLKSSNEPVTCNENVITSKKQLGCKKRVNPRKCKLSNPKRWYQMRPRNISCHKELSHDSFTPSMQKNKKARFKTYRILNDTKVWYQRGQEIWLLRRSHSISAELCFLNCYHNIRRHCKKILSC